MVATIKGSVTPYEPRQYAASRNGGAAYLRAKIAVRGGKEVAKKEEHKDRDPTGIIPWLNQWDFHELAYVHETYGRIFICENGQVVAWENGEK